MKYKTRKILASIVAFVCALLLILTFCTFPALAETAEAQAPAVTTDITQILLAVLYLVFAFAVALAVPPLKKWLNAKASQEQQGALYNFVSILVNAAEQVIGSGHGAEKKAYVVDALEKKGYTVDADMIEAAVWQMNDRLINKLFEPVVEATDEKAEEETSAE